MIDIHSKGDYPSSALSNFAAYDFTVDGARCASMVLREQEFIGQLYRLREKLQEEEKR